MTCASRLSVAERLAAGRHGRPDFCERGDAAPRMYNGVCAPQPAGDRDLTEIIVVTSGKGGVGKTTPSASLACGLARRGKRVAVIDFDIGLRNLDLIMGCERRVVYDFGNGD